MDVEGQCLLSWASPMVGMFVHQGAQKTNSLVIRQFSFPVTFDGFSTVYKSLSVSVEVLIEKEK